MKLTFKSLAILLAIISTSICCKSKQYTFENYDGNILSIGSSGGFTGRTTKYFVFENGQLFKQNDNKNSVTELLKIDKRLVKQQFDMWYQLGFDTLKMDRSGNMTNFMIMNEKSDSPNAITWENGSLLPNHIIETYYNNLSAIIKKHNQVIK